MSSSPPSKDRRRKAELPEQIVGRRYLRPLQSMLGTLREASVDASHGNRKLFLDDIVVAHLLALFNPVVRSLRMIEDLSQTPSAQKLLTVDRLPHSTLSDAHAACDPALLHPMLQHLIDQLPKGAKLEGDLAELTQQIIAVDASYFAVLAELHWALNQPRSNGKPGAKIALHVHLDVALGVPRHVEVTGKGSSEAGAAAPHLQPGAIYLFDRGYVSFDLIRDCLDKQADFVLRLTTQTRMQTHQTLDLSDQDRAAGIISDRLVVLTGCDKSQPPGQVLREVLVANPDDPNKPMRLLTSLLDLPARLIVLLYHRRWQVELFFRWLKVYAHFNHLLSRSQAGVAMSFYVATIGVVLLCLHNNRRPSKYDVAMLAHVAAGGAGGATLDDIAPILAERHRQTERDRLARARRRARQGACGPTSSTR